jgi:hypothetical protein
MHSDDSQPEKASLSNRIGAFIGTLMTGSLVACYIWGTIFSFTRFGLADGALTLVIPPYAVYRGASWLWVEPKWKESWDHETKNMAFLVLMAPRDSLKGNPEILQMIKKTQAWVKTIPAVERQKLHARMQSLRHAVVQYTQLLLL